MGMSAAYAFEEEVYEQGELEAPRLPVVSTSEESTEEEEEMVLA